MKRARAGAVVAAAALAMFAPGASAVAGTLFGLVDTGELFASQNGGVSWTVRATLPVRDAVGLVAGATSSDLLLATRSGSLYRSLDAGTSWNAVSAISASDVAALVARQGTALLASASGSVYRSLDGGASWTAVGAIVAGDVVGASTQGTSWFALTRTGSVYRSTDAGASWSAIGAITTSDAVALAAWGGALYAMTGAGDVYRSLDGGVTFAAVSTLSQVGATGIIAGFGELVACLGTGETASGSGTSWTWRGAIGQLTVRALATDQPTTTGVPIEGPNMLRLAGPWPNPARGEVRLALELDAPGIASLELLDVHGRVVARLAHRETWPAGATERVWRPHDLPAGSYFLHARVADREITKRLVWLGAR